MPNELESNRIGPDNFTPESVDEMEIQEAIMDIQNLLTFIKTGKDHEEGLQLPRRFLQREIKDVAWDLTTMKQLLRSRECVDKVAQEKIQKVLKLMEKFKTILTSYEVPSTDKDIDRILYKVNVMRTFTQILLTEHAASDNLSFNENLDLLEILRHVSEFRTTEYYQEKLEKKAPNQTANP